MKVAVKDANILIDLAQCGGLDAWFSLGIETYTTTLVLNEITDVNQRSQIQSYVRAQSLRVVDYDGAKLAQAFALKRGGLGSLTIQDATVRGKQGYAYISFHFTCSPHHVPHRHPGCDCTGIGHSGPGRCLAETPRRI